MLSHLGKHFVTKASSALLQRASYAGSYCGAVALFVTLFLGFFWAAMPALRISSILSSPAFPVPEEPFWGDLVTISWDIDPAGTRAVLVTATADADAQNQAATRLGASLDGAGTVVGGGLVGKALHEYAEISVLPHLTAIAGRSNRIIEGAAVALTAYVRADADMARQAQASASTLAADGSGLGRVSRLDGGGSLSWGGRRSPERG